MTMVSPVFGESKLKKSVASQFEGFRFFIVGIFGEMFKTNTKKAGFIEAFQGGYKNGEFIQTSNLMQIYGNLINDPWPFIVPHFIMESTGPDLFFSNWSKTRRRSTEVMFPVDNVGFFTSNCQGVFVCFKYTRKGCVILTPLQGQYLDFVSGYCLPCSGKVGRYFPCILEDVYTALNCLKSHNEEHQFFPPLKFLAAAWKGANPFIRGDLERFPPDF